MKSIYSIMMKMEKLHLLYAIRQVETIVGKWQRRKREQDKRGESVRYSVLLKRVGISHISWSLEMANPLK